VYLERAITSYYCAQDESPMLSLRTISLYKTQIKRMIIDTLLLYFDNVDKDSEKRIDFMLDRVSDNELLSRDMFPVPNELLMDVQGTINMGLAREGLNFRGVKLYEDQEYIPSNFKLRSSHRDLLNAASRKTSEPLYISVNGGIERQLILSPTTQMIYMYALKEIPRHDEVIDMDILYSTARYVLDDKLTLEQVRTLARTFDSSKKYIRIDLAEEVEYEFVEISLDIVNVLMEPKITISRSKTNGYDFKLDKVRIYVAKNQGDYSHNPDNALFGPGTINGTFSVCYGFHYAEIMKSLVSYSVPDLGKAKILVDDVFQITTGHGISLITPQIILTHDEEKVKFSDKINFFR